MAEVLAAVARGQIVHPTISSFADYVRHPGIVSQPLEDAAPLTSVLATGTPPSPALRAFLAVADPLG